MKTTKVSQATGRVLDWLVTKAEEITEIGAQDHTPFVIEWIAMRGFGDFCYSTNWAQGGPIIERELLLVSPSPRFAAKSIAWFATRQNWRGEIEWGAHGPTPLVAAMRCYVSSKLGVEVEVPEELL